MNDYELNYEEVEREAGELSAYMISDLIDTFIKDDRQHIIPTVQTAIADQMFEALYGELHDIMDKLNIPEINQEDIGNIVSSLIVFSQVSAVYEALQKIRLTSNDTNG